MNSPISRREFVSLSAGVVAGAALARATSGHDSPTHPIPHFDVALPMPRVLQPIRRDATTDYYEIVQREKRVEIVPGRYTTIWDTTGRFPDRRSKPGAVGPSSFVTSIDWARRPSCTCTAA